MNNNLDSLLDQYAELVVRVGLNVQHGQRVFIRGTRGEPELVYRASRVAYRAGAEFVHVLWEDDELDLIRAQQAPGNALNFISDWYVQAFNGSAERRDAFLLLHSPDSALFAGVPVERAAALRTARSTDIRRMLTAQGRNDFQWTVARVPNPTWAKHVFPDAAPGESESKLWDAIFAMCRIDLADPVAAWQSHLANLQKRRAALTAKQYDALHYQAPGTDLTLGLPRGHIWFGGDSVSPDGIPFVPNIPTEEVFTMPHRERAEGYVTMTRPLSVNGVLIEKFTLTFEHGRITSVQASNAQDALEQLIASDEGASHLGEVALVPASNPIARMNTIFYDGLYDENAASHIAMGRSYRFTLERGTQMSEEEYAAAGGNNSLIHEDTMIGSAEMNIDGLFQDGSHEAVMRAGEWAFEV